VLNRTFDAPAPNRKWIADFTYVWTAEGWLYVAAVIDLFSRRAVGWSMSTAFSTGLCESQRTVYLPRITPTIRRDLNQRSDQLFPSTKINFRTAA